MAEMGDTRLPERFWAKVSVNETTGCWEWTGSKTKGGYGNTTKGGRGSDCSAHRWSYEALSGEIPKGLDIDHLCRVRHCVNPDHLEPVTRQENLRRGAVGETQRARHAAKTHCPQGHPYDEDNTYMHRGRGGYINRQCRACRRARIATKERRAYMRAYHARRRAQAEAQARDAVPLTASRAS